MLKIKIKNCCCCNSGSGGGGNSGDTTTKYIVTIGAPVDEDDNIISNPTILVDDIEKQVGDTIEVNAGSTITVKVTADGYEDFEQEYTINESQTITPVLTVSNTEPVYYSVTVNTTPSSATVTMNGTSGKVQSFLKGSNISIVASKSGYENRTAQVTNIQEDTVINLTLPEEPDPYDGYRLTPNSNSLNNAYTTNRNTTTGEAGSEVEFDICSWIYNTSLGTGSTPGIADPNLPTDRTQVTEVAMSLTLNEGGEYLDSYELIHFTKFASQNESGSNVILANADETETNTVNFSSGYTTNPKAYYRLKFKVKENITGTIKFTITQATSGKKIIYTYTVN